MIADQKCHPVKKLCYCNVRNFSSTPWSISIFVILSYTVTVSLFLCMGLTALYMVNLAFPDMQYQLFLCCAFCLFQNISISQFSLSGSWLHRPVKLYFPRHRQAHIWNFFFLSRLSHRPSALRLFNHKLIDLIIKGILTIYNAYLQAFFQILSFFPFNIENMFENTCSEKSSML